MKLISIEPSNDMKTKYTAKFLLDNGKFKNIKFGAFGAKDYLYWNKHETNHYANNMKKNYIARHEVRENFNDPITKGALSRWLLWNKPTFQKSLDDFIKRFDLST